MPNLSSQIQKIEKLFMLYGESTHRSLLKGEIYSIFCNHIFLAECVVWEALVNSFVPIRQITLQYEEKDWELEKKIINLSKMYSPFILELQNKNTNGAIEFSVKNNNGYVQHTPCGYQITVSDGAEVWGEISDVLISINSENIGFFKVNRSPFDRDKKLIIQLSDADANRVALALMNTESCLISSKT